MGYSRMVCANRVTIGFLLALGLLSTAQPAGAINITIDYRYDSNDFFDPATTSGQQARAALQAAASRFSEIITTSLGAVNLNDDNLDARIGFTHPGTGASWDVSGAVSSNTDALAQVPNGSAAEEYRGPWSIAADEWILYAGAQSIGSAGFGGTGTGLNFTTTFSDGDSVLNRGFRSTGSVNNLPVWGGAITFDNDGDRTWHFDHTTVAPLSTLDFYSIALHEIGHVLGLSTNWLEWPETNSAYTGSEAIAAYNADNGTSLSTLNLQGSSDAHFQDGIYDSNIFSGASPNLVGTVGLDSPQDLLMEPTANFTLSLRRFELTNVDVAALRDIGWQTIAPSIPGDFTGNGTVDLPDLTQWRGDYGVNGESDADNDADSDGTDFLIWQQNFGSTSAISSVAAVPEPNTLSICILAVVALVCMALPRSSPKR